MNINNRIGALKCLDYVICLSRKLKSFQEYELKSHIQIHNNNMSFIIGQHNLQTLKMDATIQKYKDIVRSFDITTHSSTHGSLHRSSPISKPPPPVIRAPPPPPPESIYKKDKHKQQEMNPTASSHDEMLPSRKKRMRVEADDHNKNKNNKAQEEKSSSSHKSILSAILNNHITKVS